MAFGSVMEIDEGTEFSSRRELFDAGVCHSGEQDIGATLIGNGLALDCPRFSGGRYAVYEVEGAARMRLPGYCE